MCANGFTEGRHHALKIKCGAKFIPPLSPTTKVMFDKIKPMLITALIAIVAVGVFSRFAPASLKKIVNG